MRYAPFYFPVSYTYDAAGQLTGASDPDATLTFTYDQLGRELTESTSGGGAGQPSVTLTAGFDAVGNRTSLTDNLSAVGRTTSTYDALDRLSTVSRSLGGASGPQVAFGYDPASRLTSLSRTIGVTGTAVATSFVYDALERLWDDRAFEASHRARARAAAARWDDGLVADRYGEFFARVGGASG